MVYTHSGSTAEIKGLAKEWRGRRDDMIQMLRLSEAWCVLIISTALQH